MSNGSNSFYGRSNVACKIHLLIMLVRILHSHLLHVRRAAPSWFVIFSLMVLLINNLLMLISWLSTSYYIRNNKKMSVCRPAPSFHAYTNRFQFSIIVFLDIISNFHEMKFWKKLIRLLFFFPSFVLSLQFFHILCVFFVCAAVCVFGSNITMFSCAAIRCIHKKRKKKKRQKQNCIEIACRWMFNILFGVSQKSALESTLYCCVQPESGRHSIRSAIDGIVCHQLFWMQCGRYSFFLNSSFAMKKVTIASNIIKHRVKVSQMNDKLSHAEPVFSCVFMKSLLWQFYIAHSPKRTPNKYKRTNSQQNDSMRLKVMNHLWFFTRVSIWCMVTIIIIFDWNQRRTMVRIRYDNNGWYSLGIVDVATRFCDAPEWL